MVNAEPAILPLKGSAASVMCSVSTAVVIVVLPGGVSKHDLDRFSVAAQPDCGQQECRRHSQAEPQARAREE